MGKGLKGFVKTLGLEEITKTVTNVANTWAQSLDQSSIINQYGSGDIMGGHIADQRRKTERNSGITKEALKIGGAAAGFIFGGGLPGLAAGGKAGEFLGDIIKSVMEAKDNKEATEIAKGALWQERSGSAMNLAAVVGDPNGIRSSFRTAADVAAEFGYSAEEGMDAIRQSALRGLSQKDATTTARQVFDYERRTGADRGALLEVSALSTRYGAGDALQAGWAGLGASGMKPGQYNEYLRSMQRVMEDGISKGFVLSSSEVVQNLTMLSDITGNNPVWQGENGARRLMDINAGLASTTELSSASDVLAFQAARNLLGEDADVTDVMMKLEKGLTPELFKEIMKLNTERTDGDRDGIVEHLRDQFNLNYTNADALVKGYNANKDYTQKEIDAMINANPLPEAKSPELDAAKVTESITNWWTKTGISHWDTNFPKILGEELAKSIKEYKKEVGDLPPTPRGMTQGDEMRTRIRELEIARASRNDTRIQEAELRLNQSFRNVHNVADRFFTDEGKDESNAMSAISRTFRNGAISSDLRTVKQTAEAAYLLERLPENIRVSWDESNKLNKIEHGGDMSLLLKAIRDLIDIEIEKGNLNVNFRTEEA